MNVQRSGEAMRIVGRVRESMCIYNFELHFQHFYHFDDPFFHFRLRLLIDFFNFNRQNKPKPSDATTTFEQQQEAAAQFVESTEETAYCDQ